MKQLVLSLCMFALCCALVQSILPQGKLKQTATFACSICLVALFLQNCVQLFQNFDISVFAPDINPQYEQQTYQANAVYVNQLVQSIAGDRVQCRVVYDAFGEVLYLEVSGPVSDAVKQSIMQVLCGIYDIERTQVTFLKGG